MLLWVTRLDEGHALAIGLGAEIGIGDHQRAIAGDGRLPETVAEHWGQIKDVSDFYVPADTDSVMNSDWIAANSTVLSA